MTEIIRRWNDSMGYGCCGTGFQKERSFLTKEERIALLKGYKDELEKEGQGGSGTDQRTRSLVDMILLPIFIF